MKAVFVPLAGLLAATIVHGQTFTSTKAVSSQTQPTTKTTGPAATRPPATFSQQPATPTAIPPQQPPATGGAAAEKSPDRVARLISGLAVVASLLSIFLVYASNRRSTRIQTDLQRTLKGIDLTRSSTETFYQIEAARPAPPAVAGNRFYERLWGLYFEELYYYRAGALEKKLFQTWLSFRHSAYHADLAHEQPQWTRIRASHITDPTFVTLIDAVLALPAATASHGIAALLDDPRYRPEPPGPEPLLSAGEIGAAIAFSLFALAVVALLAFLL